MYNVYSSLKHEMNVKYMRVYKAKRFAIKHGYKTPYQHYHNMLDNFLDGMTCTACYLNELSMDEFSKLLEYRRMIIERFDSKFEDEE